MKALAFAWRSVTRRRAQSLLGILGIAAAGALTFDMLLLSRGLLVSVRELLDSFGYDVRVMASEGIPQGRTPLDRPIETAERLAQLPEVAAAVPFRVEDAETTGDGRPAPVTIFALGASGGPRMWTVLRGDDLPAADAAGPPSIVVSERTAARLAASPGGTVSLRGRCGNGPSVLPPVPVRVAGVVSFPFEAPAQLAAAGRFTVLDALCGRVSDSAELIMVASRPDAGPDAAVAAIRKQRPDLFVYSNDEVIERFEQVGFSYFRQISAALSVVTMSFGVVLIAVLLTVSVNQRLGEIAALRAIGFSRARAAADVLWEALLLVGLGGAVSVPLGLALSWWLDRILRSLPGVPGTLHFFVFEPRALVLHVLLLAAVGLAAAIYPVWLVSRLPIASTLRKEFVS